MASREDFASEAKAYLGRSPTLIASAPGRADLFNTHQDYKMLPVVPVAITKRIYFLAIPIEEKRIVARSADLCKAGEPSDIEIDLENPSVSSHDFAGYLSAVIRTVNKFITVFRENGLKVYVRSEIPVAAGLGSSGALEVAFLKLLNGTFSLGLSDDAIAEYSYLAESYDLGIPCGRLDQYASTFGGAIILKQRPIVSVERLPMPHVKFAVIDSGEKHRTGAIHPLRQAEIDQALLTLQASPIIPKTFKNKLGRTHFETDWEGITKEEIARFLFMISEKSGKRILFTVQMNESTKLIVDFLKSGKINRKKFLEVLGERRFHALDASNWPIIETMGEIMNVQHELLRDSYEVSTPKLETLRDVALMSGAIGVKISGAGMGGSLIALIRPEDSGKSIKKAALEVGASNVWIVGIDSGADFSSK